MKVTPHVAQNTSGRRSAIDSRTTRHARLCRQPAHQEAHRGGVRLDQDRGRAGEDQVPRPRSCRMGLHLRVPPPTIWCGCRSSSRRPADGQGSRLRQGLCRLAGASSRWTTGTTTFSISSKKRISPSTVRRMARSPSAPSRASWMCATARATARPAPSFRGKGHDENDPACGRGWVMIGTAGRLVGHFYIHNGDEFRLRLRTQPDFFNSLLAREIVAKLRQVDVG